MPCPPFSWPGSQKGLDKSRVRRAACWNFRLHVESARNSPLNSFILLLHTGFPKLIEVVQDLFWSVLGLIMSLLMLTHSCLFYIEVFSQTLYFKFYFLSVPRSFKWVGLNIELLLMWYFLTQSRITAKCVFLGIHVSCGISGISAIFVAYFESLCLHLHQCLQLCHCLHFAVVYICPH